MSAGTSNWAIVGAAGYTAGELCRLLLQHPHARVTRAVSSSSAGKRVGDVHPNLRGLCDLPLSGELGDPSQLDGVFLCLPHGESMGRVPALLSAGPGLRIIDLSADFRLKDASLYPRWYGREHAAPELLESFVYGLPELHRDELRGAARVANPGCFATAVTLALLPMAGQVDQAAVTAVTGSSGSGARPSERTHHPTRAATMRAYRVLGHQHTPEILQALGDRADLSFVPVSGPFVRLLDAPPDLQVVTGSNFCDLHVVVEGDRMVVVAAIDNLVKGAAGQAVQNLNLAMGWDEDAGLRLPGGYP